MDVTKQDILGHLKTKYPNSTMESIESYYRYQSYNDYWDRVAIKSKSSMVKNDKTMSNKATVTIRELEMSGDMAIKIANCLKIYESEVWNQLRSELKRSFGKRVY